MLYCNFDIQKVPVNSFKWKKKKCRFTQNFVQNYDNENNKGYILEVYVSYPKCLQKMHNDLMSLPKITKIDKCEKLVCNMKDKKNYLVHIKPLSWPWITD